MSVVCFIAVSYFGSKDLDAYIESLMGQTDRRWLLKIVDNSQDREEGRKLQELASRDPRIEVWVSDSNLGYFGAAEWARSRMDDTDCEWIAVTNTDVFLAADNFVEELADSSNLGAAVLAPAIHGCSSRSALNPYMYFRPTTLRTRIRRMMFWNVSVARVTVLVSHLRRRIAPDRSTPLKNLDIYAGHGSFLLFARSFFTQGGDFNHSSFLFGEELTVAEFCRTHRMRTVYCPRLQVEHTEHASTGILRSTEILKAQVGAAKNALTLISTRR